MAPNSGPIQSTRVLKTAGQRRESPTRSWLLERGNSSHLDALKKNPSKTPHPLSELKKSNSRTTNMGCVVDWTKMRSINKKLNSVIVKPYYVDLMKIKDVKEFTQRLKHMTMLLELVGH